MINVNNADGDFDFDIARQAVGTARGISNQTERSADLDAIIALTLIDIAGSLAVLAAAPAAELYEATFTGESESVVEPVDLTEADAGTRVRLIAGEYGLDHLAEGELTGAGGIDQGVPWVGVFWDGDAKTDAEVRVFVPHLEAVHAPTAPVAVELGDGDFESRPGRAAEAYIAADELDADFDGDEHPATDAAVATLKAREKAAKKAKAGKKGGE